MSESSESLEGSQNSERDVYEGIGIGDVIEDKSGTGPAWRKSSRNPKSDTDGVPGIVKHRTIDSGVHVSTTFSSSLGTPFVDWRQYKVISKAKDPEA